MKPYTDAAKRRVRDGFYQPAGEALPNNGRFDPKLIAELKPKSPSAGKLLRRPAESVLADFVRGGATGLSVLADGDFFDGSPELVRQAHATGLPMLWKDFVVEDAQIEAAHHNGASAVLLIERCLSPQKRDELIQRAHDHRLQVLLEGHIGEGEAIRDTDADWLGINARDLSTLEMNPEGALLELQHLDRRAVALSGIGCRAHVRRAHEAGARGVLVGTRLMRDARPDLVLKALQRPLAKVCGVQHAEDGQDADLVGVVVASRGPRSRSPKQAQSTLEALGRRGVLVSDNPKGVEHARLLRPAFLQSHVPVPVEVQRELARNGTRVMHAIGPKQPIPPGYAVVLEPKSGHGGSGKRHTPQAAPAETMSFIAGGLHADNVAEAVTQSGAWGADASSGLEDESAHKDPSRVQKYIRACWSTP